MYHKRWTICKIAPNGRVYSASYSTEELMIEIRRAHPDQQLMEHTPVPKIINSVTDFSIAVNKKKGEINRILEHEMNYPVDGWNGTSGFTGSTGPTAENNYDDSANNSALRIAMERHINSILLTTASTGEIQLNNIS